MSAASDPIPLAAVALGGERLSVTYLDGRTEEILLPFLANPEQDYPRFLDVAHDEYALVEFVAKREAGWARALHPASLLDLNERILAVNFPLVRRWAELRTRKLGLLTELRSIVPAAASASPKP